MANCANSWVHLRTKHPNLHLNLTKKDYLALVEAKVGPTKLANPQLDTSNALSLLSDPKAQHLPIQGLAFDYGYVCNHCKKEGIKSFASKTLQTMWQHGHSSHGMISYARRNPPPIPPFCTETMIQQPWIGLECGSKTYLPVSLPASSNSSVTLNRNLQDNFCLDHLYSFIDQQEASRTSLLLEPADSDTATRLLGINKIVDPEVARKYHWLGSGGAGECSRLAEFREELGQHCRALTTEMDNEIRSLSTLDIKCLVMEGELIKGSDYCRYLKSVQENSTLMRYANELTFLVNYVCVVSERGFLAWAFGDDAAPVELLLTEHEKSNLDTKVGLLTNWWSEKGELDPEHVWDLVHSILLRVLNPFAHGNNDVIIRLGCLRCANKLSGRVRIRDRLRQYCAAMEHMTRLVAVHSAKQTMEALVFPSEFDENTKNRARRASVQSSISQWLNRFCAFGNLGSFKGLLISYSRHYEGPRVHASSISSDLFSIDTVQLSFSGFRRCILSAIDVVNAQVESLLDGFNPTIPHTLIDDPRDEMPNVSFKDPNGLLEAYKEYVAKLVLSNKQWEFLGSEINSPLTENNSTLCEQFREKCDCIEGGIATISCLGTGGGGRGTTLFSVLLRNTDISTRNLFFFDGFFVLLLRYDKTSHIKESDQVTIRVFPPSLFRSLYIYLVYLKPVLAVIKAKLETTIDDDERKNEIKTMTLDHLYSGGQRGRWSSADFRERVKENVDLTFPHPIGNYTRLRQAIQYMAKCFLSSSQSEKPELWEMLGFDDQQGHSIETGELCYGVTDEDVTGLCSESSRRKQFHSSFWWFKHMLGEGPLVDGWAAKQNFTINKSRPKSDM
jgi:hypothetical protein